MSEPVAIDPTRPSSPRVYDALLGGKDHYPVDRAVAEQIAQASPLTPQGVREQRDFIARSVRWVAGQGVRQFLDIGTGLPTAENVHQVAQAVDPSCRIVYVDNDPVVLAHARALLTGTPEGVTAYLDADARDPQRILRLAADSLDLDQPIGLVVVGVLHHLTDDEDPSGVVRTLVAGLASGSYLIASHVTGDAMPEQMERNAAVASSSGIPFVLRSHDFMTQLFEGLDVVEPGIVGAHLWRPEAETRDPHAVQNWAAVGRKP